MSVGTSFKFSRVGLAIVAALASSTAFAEEAASESQVTVDSNIERISVTGRSFNDYKVGSSSGAMRGDIDIMDTPQSVTVIPDFVTDEQLATNLSEVLVNDSSVTGGSEKWNRQVFNIRGFELDSGSGYLINGQQQWSHYVQPIETLQQVEVLKGPSSMLYGQSGPGGLINMVTKKPTYENMFELGFDTDENGSTRFQLDAGGSLNESETIRYRTVLVKQDTKYWREYQDGTNQERDRWLGYLNLEFDITDDLLLSLKYDHTQDKTGIDRGGWLDSSGDLIGGRDLIWDQPWAFTDNTISNLGAELTYNITDDWKVKAGYNDQQFNRQRLDSSPSYSEDALTDGYKISPFDRYDDWQHKTGYVDFTGNFYTGDVEHQLLIGANMLDYYYGMLRVKGASEVVQVGQPVPNPGLDYHDDPDGKYESEYKHYGFYVQDLVTLNDQWQLLAGVRYDEQKKDGAGNNSYAVSPKFGVIYSPADNGSIYVNYSKSFTPQGSVNDENDINDKLNLDPEYGEQYEIGTKWELFDGSLLLTGAVFDITVSNVTVTEQLETPIGDKDTITTQSGEQRHKGFEMGAQGQVSESWFMTGSMMYLDAEYVRPETDSLNGKTPVDAPEWSANIWTRYEMTDDLALNFGAIYVGERFANTDNTISKDGYVRFDMGAAYTMDVMGSDVSVRVNVKNLFDKDYLAGGTNTDVTVGQGRHFSLALEAKF
ncbi:TonB-dependent receptor [Shewanella fidelis]|uniref:TonB-dependent receptor n=1 Tax=Shewanella fidelis TaxID=173509 RepID=A0AAW8NRT1_9GAMM|nr:TonB-dependent receptor [Shewanella fidelis]MDR8525884.1 TonB-dependent receptor [Shewanella fidelis]MDW4813975.1 TonB-dependent receptor [Shewanella fidelis]MDW4818024.1 TonB-dependent receptor [Shewanella fidelis]MDW4822138.1 TonB-dependent receptor [Shewanella fidelis]MDW4826256.1 TonB-dependent receptor [Shewanella fidelis]